MPSEEKNGNQENAFSITMQIEAANPTKLKGLVPCKHDSVTRNRSSETEVATFDVKHLWVQEKPSSLFHNYIHHYKRKGLTTQKY